MLVAPLYTLLRRRSGSIEGMVFDTRAKITLYVSNSIFQWIITLVVVILWVVQGNTLGTMGLQMPNWDRALETSVVMAIFWIAYAWNTWRQIGTPKALEETRIQWRTKTPFMPDNSLEFRWFIGVAFTAGICEEIIFRGFLMTYLQALSYGSPKIQSIVVSAAVFAVLHLYQGRIAALKIFAFALLFGGLYVLTNSLLLSIFIHVLVDLISGWIGYKIILRQTSGDIRNYEEGEG